MLASFNTYCYIRALKRELRMSDRNKKCVLLLVISLMTVIILEYTYSESYCKEARKQQVSENIEVALQSENNYFQETDDECENDQDFENRNGQLEQYLANRRKCLLKYCGDVCKTKSGADKGISLRIEFSYR